MVGILHSPFGFHGFYFQWGEFSDIKDSYPPRLKHNYQSLLEESRSTNREESEEKIFQRAT